MFEDYHTMLGSWFTQPRGPRPCPPRRHTKRALRRYEGRMKATGWARVRAWERLGKILGDAVQAKAKRKGFMRHLLDAASPASMTWKPRGSNSTLTLTAEEAFREPGPSVQALVEAEDERILAEMRASVQEA